jgi:plasmid stabilization system protein ParE
MPRRLNWLPAALSDLARLREFISIHNPAAANRAASSIRVGAGQLLDHPHLGKSVEDINNPNLRDLFIPFGQGGYWLRYLIRQEDIVIVRIWHGRENRNTNL